MSPHIHGHSGIAGSFDLAKTIVSKSVSSRFRCDRQSIPAGDRSTCYWGGSHGASQCWNIVE